MQITELPEQGIAFFFCEDGRVILRRGVDNHFELMAIAARSKVWEDIEEWIRRQPPRFGRVGLRGGQPDLVALTKPLGAPAPGSEDESQDQDPTSRAQVLRVVLTELARA